MSIHVSWLVSFFTLSISTGAHAEPTRIWSVDFWQTKHVIARLIPVPPAIGGEPCREGFQYVRLETQANLSEIGRISVGKNAPEFFQSTAIEKGMVRKNLDLEVDLAIEGCSFGIHFVPVSGHIDLFGDFGPAQIGPSRFGFFPSRKKNTMNAWYTAQLLGDIRTPGFWRRKEMVPLPSASGTRQIGELLVSIAQGPFAMLNADFADDVVTLDLDLKVILEETEGE